MTEEEFMDAAQTPLKKTALFFTLALFGMAGGLKAQTAFNNPGTVTLTVGGAQATITSNSSTQIAYQATLGSFSVPPTDPANWVQISGGSTGTTPNTITFSLLNVGSAQGTYTAVCTLHATDASGAADLTFTVTFTSGTPGGGGGGSNGTVTASTTNLVLSTNPGNVTSGTITLSTTSTTPITFSATPTPLNSWLTFGLTSQSVTNTSSATLTVIANTSSPTLITTNQIGSILITPSSGTTTSITVTLNVGNGGTGTGTITASPNPVNLSYTSNSGVFPSALVSLTTTTGSTSYTATATSSNGWLTVTSGGTIGVNGLSVNVSGAIGALVTGLYQGTISITDGLGGSGTLTVNLTVNGGTTSGLTLSPSAGLTFNAAVGTGSTAAQTIQVTSGVSGTVSLTCSSTGWLVCSGNPTNINANSPTNFTVSANAAGQSNITLNGQFAITVTPNTGTALSASVNISLVVGSGSGSSGGGATGFALTPTSLSYSYQTGTPRSSVQQQTVGITGTGTWLGTTTTTAGGAWLNIFPVQSPFQADGTSSTRVTIDPNGLTTGNYTGTVTITNNGVPQTVTVSLSVVASPILLPTPGSVLVNFHTGDPAPQPTAIFLSASDGSAVTATAATTTPWITVSQTPGATSFSISVDPTGMASGLFTGADTVTQAGLANSPMTIPVVLMINGGTGTGGGTLTLTPASLTFNAAVNGASPPSQSILVTAATSTNYSVATSTLNGGNWLSASQSSGVTGASIVIFVNSTGLPIGIYNGTVTFSVGSSNQTVPVVLNVSATGTGAGGNVTADHSSLTFTGQAGAANPAAQTVTISSASGSASVGVTVTASTTSGGNWLTVSPTSGNTQLSLTVTASLAGLVAGTYNGAITVNPSGGTVVSIPVSLTVTAAPTVSASPTSLTFTFRAGDTPPAAQTVTVSGGGSTLAFAATASSTPADWLKVAPATGNTPATISVSVDPTGLNASATPYTGTVTVAGTGTATGTTAITVTLTVTAPLPTVSKITNAGSFATATAIAPGEIITLFASDAQHPIGPTTAAGLTLDSTGKVATTIGGVQVLAAGFACPMVFASATQVSAVVPYELAGFVFSGADVLVKFPGQTSNAVHVNVATTAPGLFTANSSGTGPGAILNSNGSVNSPANPATRGDVVVVYMTGEGQTTPAGVTGKVTIVASTGPLTPTPLLPIAILIGPAGSQQAASFTFAGEAPGFVSGAMQLNVRIPTTVNAGDQQIVVSVGPNSSQTGVTVSLK